MWITRPVFLKIKNVAIFFDGNVKYIQPMIHKDYIVPMYRFRKTLSSKKRPVRSYLIV